MPNRHWSNRQVTAFMVPIIAICLWGSIHAQRPATSAPPIAVYFSPKGGCTDAIVSEIAAARSELKVQAYSFTSTPIAKAISQAHDRGVKVTVILDKSQETEKYSGATYLADHQIPVYIDSKHGIAHNKIMIIDGATVLTGSFNFTKAAEEANAENLLVIHDQQLAGRYLGNFTEHLKHSEGYTRK